MVSTNNKGVIEAWLPQKDPMNTSLSLSSSASTLLKAYGIYSEEDAQQIAAITQKIQDSKSFEPVESEFILYAPRKPLALGTKEHLSYKAICLHILEQCVEKLYVMLEGNNRKVVKRPIKSLLYRTLSDRFQDDGTTYEKYVIGAVYTNWDRLHKETGYLISIIEELWEEFNMYSLTTSLELFANAHYQMLAEEKQLLSEVEGKKQTVKKLLKSLSTSRDATLENFTQMDNLINETNGTIVDMKRYASDEISYLEKWERARQEQNSMVLRKDEHVHESIILGVIQKMRIAYTCHEQICFYCEESRLDILQEIEDFMEKYEKDCEQRDLNIYDMKHKIDRNRQTKEEIQRVYDEREQEMKDYLEYKRKQKEKRERLILENEAAKKIQDWWRAIIVIIRQKKKKGKKGDKKIKKG